MSGRPKNHTLKGRTSRKAYVWEYPPPGIVPEKSPRGVVVGGGVFDCIVLYYIVS